MLRKRTGGRWLFALPPTSNGSADPPSELEDASDARGDLKGNDEIMEDIPRN